MILFVRETESIIPDAQLSFGFAACTSVHST